MSELSEKEQAKIIRHFLMNSPPAQFSTVERDLRTLVTGDLVDRTLPVVSKRYNEEQMLVINVPDSEDKFVVSKVGSVGGEGNEYLEPNTNTVVQFDHIKKTATSKREATEDEKTPSAPEPFRARADALLKEYVSNYYPDGVGVAYATQEDGKFKVVACISATKANLSNRWSGRLRATYTCTFAEGDSSVSIETSLKLKVHYFEEGNVQLNCNTSPTLTCSASDVDTFAKSFVEAIEKHEQAFHTKTDQSFGDLSDNTFKHLRRKLPISGNKFNFENWASYSLGGEMSDKK